MALAWFRAVEAGAVPAVRPHLIHLPGDPRIATVCYETRDGRSGLDPTGFLLGALAPWAGRLGVSFLPALVCAPFRGHVGHLPGPERGALLEQVETLADRLGLSLHFPRVLDEDEELCRLLATRGYWRTADRPVAVLDIVWNSFEHYLASLRRSARSNVRIELRRNREAGIRIAEIDDVAALAPRLHQLVDAHYLRLNGVPIPFAEPFLPALKASLGSDATFYGAFHGETLVGVSVMLRHGDTSSGPIIGLAARDVAFSYFNLAFYRPITDAIAAGQRRLYLGTMLYEPKVRRGARVLATSHFYRGRSRSTHLVAAPWLMTHGWWARRHKFARALALNHRAPAR